MVKEHQGQAQAGQPKGSQGNEECRPPIFLGF